MKEILERKLMIISITIVVSLMAVIIIALYSRPTEDPSEKVKTFTARKNRTPKPVEFSRNIPLRQIIAPEGLQESLTGEEIEFLRMVLIRKLLDEFPDKFFIFIDWVWCYYRPIPSLVIRWEEIPENEVGYCGKVPKGIKLPSIEGLYWNAGVKETQKDILWDQLKNYLGSYKNGNEEKLDIESAKIIEDIEDTDLCVACIEITNGPTSFGRTYLTYSGYLAFLQNLQTSAIECNNLVLSQGIEEIFSTISKQESLQTHGQKK